MSLGNESFFNFLDKRGFIEKVSSEDIIEILNREKIVAYIGFDPTAKSLHVGHLLPVMFLAHLQNHGHTPIIVVGGATGIIGDPSGRSSERRLLSNEEVRENLKSMKKQLKKFLDLNGDNSAIMLDNYEWISDFSFLDWLRKIGKNFTINYMLSKESIRRRLEDREQGISYTEFSYMLLQAYDFLHLYKTYNCILQGGGSDQWGNIVAGIDYIRKVTGETVYGITFPLVTTTIGKKFGKSEGNAIWLDKNMTSVWDFYQYWVRTHDKDVIKYLKLFTFLSEKKINLLEEEVKNNPEERAAQRKLAEEVTAIVHGEENADRAQKGAKILYGEDISEVDSETLEIVFENAPTVLINMKRLKEGILIMDFLNDNEIVTSKSEARRLLNSGGIYVNEDRISKDYVINESSLLTEKLILLRKGKKHYWLIRVKG